MNIVYSSRFDRLTEYNSSFDKGVLKVCYVGKNRNNSFIGKETFERCMPSIYNCPIVCRYDRETDEIGAHDMEVVKGNDGAIYLANITEPVGVIPESARYWWEEVEEDDGSIHEYLFVDALLWKRQEAYKKIKEDGITDESMEISVMEGSMKDGVYVIEQFEFTAFCLLGTAEPCYESASLMMFSRDDFKAQLNEMMREFKDSLSGACLARDAETCLQNILEGGEETLDEKKTLMEQYGLSEDMLDFNMDDFSIEELTEKFNSIKAKAEMAPGENHEHDFALAEQFREELITALSAEKIDTCFGEMSRYWYMDYDSEAMEVYCYDQEDWRLYGFHYSMNGDNVIVDFKSKKRKKCAIVDFDEGEQQAVFSDVYSAMSTHFSSIKDQWEQKYQLATDKISNMESELAQLRQFKEDIERESDDQKRNEIFSQFEDLSGIAAFEKIRDNYNQYSLEELEEKCYAIRGRKSSMNFSVSGQRPPKLPVVKNNDSVSEPYGGVFSEFGIFHE